ncbi:MAG: thiamine pyrophosphate-binding protein [Nitrososphaerota archaeon]|nr:thiamine pyrophosphate-binding protein [Nitrososphaerota archaeon]
MTEITGGHAVARLLKEYKVEFMFGQPGGQTLQIYDGIYELAPSIRHIMAHDEKSAVFMADGYARLSFKPGVCDATVGPGTTNMLSGIAEAYGNSIPLIAITSDVQSKYAGKGVSQECDQLAVLRPFTKASFRVDRTERIPEFVRRAFSISVNGRPGPVHLDFPEDVLQGKSDFKNSLFAEADCSSYPGRRVAPEKSRIAEAVRLIQDAERPVVLCGGGTILSQAWDEVVELAELLGSPVATTITGKGSIPENHPLAFGPIGRQGYREPADKVVEESDVLIAVGCKFAQISTDNWTLISSSTKIIHIDIDPSEIGRVYPVAVGITADSKLGLRALIDALNLSYSKGRISRSGWFGMMEKARKEWTNSASSLLNSDSIPIKPERVVKEIRNILSPESVFVSDTSFTGAFTACYFDVLEAGRTFYQQRGMAGIGGGLPAAIGAKCAVGEKMVIGMGGDGSFAYHVSELETARRHSLQVIYVISDNGSLGWIRYLQEKIFSKRVISTRFGAIDFAKVAEGYGCFGRLVERPSEIRSAIEEGIRSGLPSVIHVKTDFNEVPPIGRKTTYAS